MPSTESKLKQSLWQRLCAFINDNKNRALNSQSRVPLFVPIGCALAIHVTMGIPDLIGCACPIGLNMTGCFRLLDMAVMMGHCTLRQIRETGSMQARLNDTNTDSEAAQPIGWQTLPVAGGFLDRYKQLCINFSSCMCQYSQLSV